MFAGASAPDCRPERRFWENAPAAVNLRLIRRNLPVPSSRFTWTLSGALLCTLLLLSGAGAWGQSEEEEGAPAPRVTTSRNSRPAVSRVAAEEAAPSVPSVPRGVTRDYYPEGEMFAEEDWAGDVGPPCGGCGNCGVCGMYVRAEYLVWAGKGMNLPPLVTTGNVNTTNPPAGVINEDGSIPSNTIVLFGNETVNSNARSGGRITFGTWFNPCWGLEGDYFGIADERTNFSATSTGTTRLARPFFDESANGLPAVFRVAIGGTGAAPGSVDAHTVNSFQGAGVRVLRNLCNWQGCSPSIWDGCVSPSAKRVDLILGYRFLRLDDSLDIGETHLIGATTRVGRDYFDSENQFHGFDLGTMVQFRRGCWSLDLISKVGIGNTHSVVLINGTAVQGGVQQAPGSILAVSTNIGRHETDRFSMVPELGMNVGYQINPCWRLTAGYNFLYWSSVYRAGDQIDLHVNPDLWPPVAINPAAAGQWPQYPARVNDYWVQGLNLGIEAQW